MEPSPNNITNNRRTSISTQETPASLVVKKKSTRACAPCRKRKVKCNGQYPCERCTRSETTCVYDKPQQKKDAPKPATENPEPKLKAIEQFLRQFSRVLDIKDPEPPLFTNPPQLIQPSPRELGLSIDTTGCGTYVPDYPYRIDRASQNHCNFIIQTQEPILNEPIQQHLLKIYFQFIDPVIPVLHKPSFLHQLNTKRVSRLLLNAMYCVSSRWDLVGVPQVEDEPRGWKYYQKAISLLEAQREAQLSTIQAIFLMLKYNEHVRRPGFMWRTRYYFQTVVRMCKDLGLARDITTIPVVELECRKRTFWAAYCYDTMMSIENGTPLNFMEMPCSIDFPNILTDEAHESEKILHFILLSKIMRNQADIIQFLRCKHQKQLAIDWDEQNTYQKLFNELSTTVSLITSTTKSPRKENICYAVCFLYLSYNSAIILLCRPYDLNQCIEPALTIKNIVELILECNAFEDMYCSLRGIQQIVYYLSAAITVFKERSIEREYQITLQLAQKLASISPATEITGSQKNNRYFVQQQYHVPPYSADTTSSSMSIDSTSIPNQESLLGLLLQNESDPNNNNNIPLLYTPE